MASSELIVTHLEMRSRPSLTVTRPHRSGMLLRLEPPTSHFYRFLYETVGSGWGWTDRSDLSDEDLLAVIADPDVHVFVLYMGGVPAGMFELDLRTADEVELLHFGLVTEFMGRGLGKYLLASAVESAWDHQPSRVWVRSSSLEHPQGLLIYQWAGFVPYSSERQVIES